MLKWPSLIRRQEAILTVYIVIVITNKNIEKENRNFKQYKIGRALAV